MCNKEMWDFIKDLLVETFAAFMAFWIAYHFFFEEVKHNQQKEIQDKQEEDVRKMAYFKIILENITKDYETTKGFFQEYKTEIEHDLFNVVKPKKISLKNFNRLSAIDSRGVFEALGRYNMDIDELIKSYNQINNNTDFIDDLLKDVYRINDVATDALYQDLYRVKYLIDGVSDELSGLAHEYKNKIGSNYRSNPVFAFLDSKVGEYRNMVDRYAPIDEFSNGWLLPIIEQILAQFHTEPFAEKIVRMCKQARTILAEAKAPMEEMLKTIDEAFARGDKSIEAIHEKIALLKTTSNKKNGTGNNSTTA